MGRTPVYIFFIISAASVSALTVNETSSTQTSLNTTKEFLNETSKSLRRGRHIIQERIELPISPHTKMQIIKIPSSVSKVKLVQPPINLRHSRGPQQFKKFPPHFRNGPWWNKKSEMDDFFDSMKVKRTLKKPIVREVSPEEFYRDEFEDEEVKRKRRPGSRVVKMKRKKAKQNILSDYLTNYEASDRPNEDEGGYEDRKNRYENENLSLRGYGPSASTIHMKQVPPPVLSQTFDNEPFHSFDEQMFHNHIPELSIKNLPSKGRQIQSVFAQQYTTHNPHVTTNFGLNEFGEFNNVHYGSKGSIADSKPYNFQANDGKFSQPDMAASEQIMSSLPVVTPGIKVIQPPVFRDVTVSHPSHSSRLISSSQPQEGISSQKATIKDILEQDCPLHDSKGYCESPPRYPMHQIKAMVKKCASLMEVMNTQPFDEPVDVYGLSKRSDHLSETNTTDPEEESTWSRSSNDETEACASNLGITEPGYAREVNSGRWFVIVQHPDTIVQRIATDTCRNSGKPCRGLYKIKCSKLNLSDKSTSCVQRYTYQRLISWDPESPEGCPRMRVFRFPSACVCHLGLI